MMAVVLRVVAAALSRLLFLLSGFKLAFLLRHLEYFLVQMSSHL